MVESNYQAIGNRHNPSSKDILNSEYIDTTLVVNDKRVKHTGMITKNYLMSHPEILSEILKDEIENDEIGKRRHDSLSNRRAAPRHRNRGYALKEMEHLSDKEFQRMFRLNRRAFYWLLSKIHHDISPAASLRQRVQLERNISATIKLAVMMRWLGGGSYLDICFAFGIAVGTFYKSKGILWGTMEAVNKFLEIGFPLHDMSRLEEISEGFSEFSHGRMKGCVMAMDGWVMKTRCPTVHEVRNQICYRNRKGVWGMVIFAGCDHKCRFTMFSAKCPGSTNDCIAWEVTDLFQSVVVRDRLPGQYYFVCDEAVSANECVLSPYGGRNIGPWRDSFNYHLSAMRQTIERAFGLLTKKFGIFARPLQCDYGRWSFIALVCAKLHNLCIDFGVEETCGVPEDFAEGDSAEVFMNSYQEDNVGTWPTNSDNSSMKRNQICEILKQQGYCRPSHARCNSKA